MVVARHLYVLALCCALPATAPAIFHATPVYAEVPAGKTPSGPDGPAARGADVPAGEGAESVAAPGLAADDAAPATGESAEGEEAGSLDPLAAGLRPRTRFLARDGDLADPEEKADAQRDDEDGEEPATRLDGIAGVDIRGREDVAAFVSPPAGYDPLLFQIEALDPVGDRRTRRLYNFEPYDPVGIRLGSFVLFPEVELAGTWSSNVFRAPDAKSDISVAARPSARLVSNWGVHALELRASGAFSSFDRFDSENDHSYLVEARGRLDFLRSTNLQLLVGRELQQESRSAIDANVGGDRADVTVDRAEASFNHRFNRLSLQVRGSVADWNYAPVRAGGILVSNDDRDYTAFDQAIRASWEFKPQLTVFSEVGFDRRDHEAPAASDGLRRDSTGERFRLGLAFGNSGRIIRGEASLGYGWQHPDVGSLATAEGILIDANVAWRVTGLTSLLFTAQSDFVETTTAGASSVLVRQVGLEVRHAFRRHVIATAGIGYTWADYAGIALDERELKATLGLEYYLSRETVLFAKVAHIDFDSSAPASDYTAEEVSIGMRLRR